MANKEEIFKKPSAEEIIKDRSPLIANTNLVEILLKFNREKYFLAIDGDLIPERFFYVRKDMEGERLTRTDANRKFMKHGPEIKYPRYRTIDQAIKATMMQRKLPVDIREERFDMAKAGYYCAFSYVPIIGVKCKEKVPLIEVVDGAKLYAYASKLGAKIVKKTYWDAERVAKEGGYIDLSVPSRTPKQRRIDVTISGIALIDNHLKYIIANNLTEQHDCPDTRYRFRFKYLNEREGSKVHNWDAHGICGWYATIDHFWNDEHNLFPLVMSQIPLPSQKFVEINDLLRYDTVILTKETHEQKEPKFYPLNNAEREIISHQAVNLLSHNSTLFCDSKIDGDLRDYKFRKLNTT